jgi:hypothetical protein
LVTDCPQQAAEMQGAIADRFPVADC